MMEGGILFSELKIRGTPLSDCERIDFEGDYRLYIKRDNHGFDAMAVSFSSCSGDDDDDVWECSELMVDVLLELTALFDGVRHVWFAPYDTTQKGYVNYPDMQGVINVMSKLRELEKELCWDCE